MKVHLLLEYLSVVQFPSLALLHKGWFSLAYKHKYNHKHKHMCKQVKTGST